MHDNYNYPAGADTPSAPWNLTEVSEKEFEVTCNQCLSKTVNITTNNYVHTETREWDNSSGWFMETSDDTSDTCWKEEYLDKGHLTPDQLIETLKKLLEEMKQNGFVYRNPAYTEHIIQECENWIIDETNYVGD